MKKHSNQGLLGAVFIGLGCSLAAIGVALVVPACADWSLSFADRAVRRGREAVGSAADTLAEFAAAGWPECRRRGALGAQLARERFGWPMIARRTSDLYGEVLAGD